MTSRHLPGNSVLCESRNREAPFFDRVTVPCMSASQVPSAGGNGVETALRFEDLQRRLRLLGSIKNRASVLHLLHALADSGEAGRQGDLLGVRGLAQRPPRVFSEPVAGLSGIDRVGKTQPAERIPLGRAGEGSTARGVGEQVGALGLQGAESVRRRGGKMRGMSEVTERTLLRGILYAFQVYRGVRCWVGRSYLHRGLWRDATSVWNPRDSMCYGKHTIL